MHMEIEQGTADASEDMHANMDGDWEPKTSHPKDIRTDMYGDGARARLGLWDCWMDILLDVLLDVLLDNVMGACPALAKVGEGERECLKSGVGGCGTNQAWKGVG